MRITLFIIFCILTFLSATRAISGDFNGVTVKEDKKIDGSDSPFEKKETPLTITRKQASNAIPSLAIFAISTTALLLLLVI